MSFERASSWIYKHVFWVRVKPPRRSLRVVSVVTHKRDQGADKFVQWFAFLIGCRFACLRATGELVAFGPQVNLWLLGCFWTTSFRVKAVWYYYYYYLLLQLATKTEASQLCDPVAPAQQRNAVMVNSLFQLYQAVSKVTYDTLHELMAAVSWQINVFIFLVLQTNSHLMSYFSLLLGCKSNTTSITLPYNKAHSWTMLALAAKKGSLPTV